MQSFSLLGSLGKRLCAALGFLTVLPLPGGCRHTKSDLMGSVPFFPVVGALIGLLAAGLALALAGFFPPLVLSVLLAGWLAMVHGGLHLDGLADTADGFLSPHGRERALHIMRDSHVGAFGVLAMGGILALKIAAIASLPKELLIKAMLLAPLAGRCAMVPMLDFLKPARSDGLGHLFSRWLYANGPERSLRWGLIAESTTAIAILLGAGWFVAGHSGLMAGIAAMGVVALFGHWCRRRIGGRTGDTVGAASEIGEAVVLVVFCL